MGRGSWCSESDAGRRSRFGSNPHHDVKSRGQFADTRPRERDKIDHHGLARLPVLMRRTIWGGGGGGGGVSYGYKANEVGGRVGVQLAR